MIGSVAGRKILDLACGTGRLSGFASHGLDQSEKMIRLAREKHPDLDFRQGDATNTAFPDAYFDVLFSFHFVMHLDSDTFSQVLTEANRILKPGGRLIFDFPSSRRRKLFRRKATGWHGNYSMNLRELTKQTNAHWTMLSKQGIMALPIHRFPSASRSWFQSIDKLLCRSPLQEWASYIVVEMIKR